MSKKILMLLLSLTVFTGLFSAPTSLKISSFTKNININYDLNGGVEVIQTLTLRHKGDALEYFLTFSSGTSGLWNNRVVSNSGNNLNYQIYRDSSKIDILKDINDNPAANEIISGSFAQSGGFQYTTISYSIHVPNGQFDLAGTYSDSFDVKLYSGNLASYISEGSKSFSLKVTMPTSLELSITYPGVSFDDTSTAMDLNFGILTAGSSRSADAVVRTNSPYSMFILSEKGGKLTHTDPMVTDIVPYTFSFNGGTIALSGTIPIQVISGATVTPWEGTRYPLNVKIGDFGMAAEGYYSDNIIITIQAQ
ncbi:MAG: spore coat protein U domain-containing protein [Spirochaetaceae bacterium]|jgi:spore coat protein U-like protein|nr:spore coat protein U domain-containing protein [Spirochaetaceae bacterium]